jgi:hypothetical protein
MRGRLARGNASEHMSMRQLRQAWWIKWNSWDFLDKTNSCQVPKIRESCWTDSIEHWNPEQAVRQALRNLYLNYMER